MPPSTLATLHREPTRHAVFAAMDAEPIIRDASLGWVVTGAAATEALLQRTELRVVDYGAVYEALERRFDCSFANLRFAFRHLPLCLGEDAHRPARRRIAEFIGARRRVVAGNVPGLVARHMALLETRSELDLVGEVLAPLSLDLIAALTGIDVPDPEAIGRISVIFDPMMGLTKRQAIDRELRTLRDRIRESHDGPLGEDEEGVRLALFILGNDTLTGTLAESLHQLIRRHPGPLSAIPFPPVPNETAVAFVEREVGTPFDYGGVSFAAGERVRLMLQSLAYSSDPAARPRIFGVGAHACLGRQLSLEVWEEIGRRLARLPRQAGIVEATMRSDDFIFTYPRRLIASLRP